MTSSELQRISFEIGKGLLESGAEIYRVEDSITRIYLAYGAQNVNVYAIPSAIITSFSYQDEPSVDHICRIHERCTNLSRVDHLNALCREICAHKLDYGAILERVHLIMSHDCYLPWQQCLATAGTGFFFTRLFGGSMAEGVCGCFICFLLWLLTTTIARLQGNPLFVNFAGGLWVSFAALFCHDIGLISAYDTVIIGSIMYLVPGLPLTNAVRDLISGDLITGISKLTEAMIVAAGIAAGAALPFSCGLFLGG